MLISCLSTVCVANSAATTVANSLVDFDDAQLERKIRLLSLTTLAFQNVGHDLPYSTIADVLQVEPSQVERWVIDGTSKLSSYACRY